jgi:secondary thiamine-phosphate synthase enzyme
MVPITSSVEKVLRDNGAPTGLCHLYVPHTTAGLTVNEGADPAVAQDILQQLQALVPTNAGFRHLEGNADAHVKASVVGCSLVVAVEAGRLRLGRWQTVFFCEFDGPRTRTVEVRVVPCPP